MLRLPAREARLLSRSDLINLSAGNVDCPAAAETQLLFCIPEVDGPIG